MLKERRVVRRITIAVNLLHFWMGFSVLLIEDELVAGMHDIRLVSHEIDIMKAICDVWPCESNRYSLHFYVQLCFKINEA